MTTERIDRLLTVASSCSGREYDAVRYFAGGLPLVDTTTVETFLRVAWVMIDSRQFRDEGIEN